MKKILITIDDGKRIFAHTRIDGMLERIRKSCLDISLFIFRSGAAYDQDDDYNIGECNIYQLPDLNEFDAIIMDICTTTKMAADRFGTISTEDFLQAAIQSGKPVISVTIPIEGTYFVGIDNYTAMRSMIQYIDKTHHLKDYWLIMGPKTDYENGCRLQAVKDYMKTHGIVCPENQQIFLETYEAQSGYRGFLKLFSAHGTPPEAVICANDNIAVGVCRAAEELGFRIPDDFLLSGFDNFDLSAYYSPKISTIDQQRFEVGGTCIDVLEKIWSGEQLPSLIYTPTRLIPRESTRAVNCGQEDLEKRLAKEITVSLDITSFRTELLYVEYRLPNCGSVAEICRTLARCIPALRCESFYLILDPKVKDYRHQVTYDFTTNQVSVSNAGLRSQGYPDAMELVFAWKDGQILETGECSLHGLLPDIETEEAGKDYLFVPLHFRRDTIGYILIKSGFYMMDRKFIAPVANTITSALQNYFHEKKLVYLNQLLSGISITDELTGFYNRFGLHRLADELFDNSKKEGRSLAVLFIDVDRMKFFNDTYGHACGDDTLLTVAASIRKQCPADAIPVRYGGDEFLVVFPVNAPETIGPMLVKIQEQLPIEAALRKMPAVPAVSAGYVLTDPDSSLSLNDYVAQADQIMYAQKKRNRADHLIP